MTDIVGRKILCECDDYRAGCPRGTELVISHDNGNGDVNATIIGGDGFEWWLSDGKWRFADTVEEEKPTMKTEAGKYYRTRDGRKVGPMEKDDNQWNDWPMSCDGEALTWAENGAWDSDFRESENDLIAEWHDESEEPETGTLQELDVKPGDVVECVTPDKFGDYYTVGNNYTIGGKDDKGCRVEESECGGFGTFRIVSRADTTQEEPEVIVAAVSARMPRTVEVGGTYTNAMGQDGWECLFIRDDVAWCSHNGGAAYRFTLEGCGIDLPDEYNLKVGPVREEVTLYGRPDVQWVYEPCAYDTHRITFDLIDGEPDCASIKMERIE